MPTLILPRKPKELAKALSDAVAAGLDERCVYAVEWRINQWYIRGAREFRDINYREGTARPRYATRGGELVFRYEDSLVQRQRELGRLQRIDTSPKAAWRTLSLGAVRKAAAAQVFLDGMIDRKIADKQFAEVTKALLDFGTVALYVSFEGSSDSAYPVVTVVPPWQLLPLPAKPALTGDATGIMYRRTVPLEWLRSRDGLKLGSEAEMEAYSVAAGARVSQPDDVRQSEALQFTGDISGTAGTQEIAPQQKVVELTECWQESYDGRVDRYIVMIGTKHIAADIRYDALEDRANRSRVPWMPIHVMRMYDTGFWARPWMTAVNAMNTEVEIMLQTLSQNVRDLDRFGYLLIPMGLGITKEDLKATGRPRVLFYQPDLNEPTMKPDQLQPATTGDFPGRVAGTFVGLMDRISGASDLFSGKAPGRVDSASGLGLLWETASVPLVPVSAAIERAYAGIYAAVLDWGRRTYSPAKAIQMSSIDDAAAGVVLGSDGSMTLESNPLPDPAELLITIREREPRSKEQRKQELVTAVQMGIVSPEDLLWINLKERLELPLGNEDILNSVLTAKQRNLLEFNDGVTPGRVAISQWDDHKVQLKIMLAFMRRPEFSLASPAVKDAFAARWKAHEQATAGYPDAMPHVEDAAMMASAGPSLAGPGRPVAGSVPGMLPGDDTETAGMLPG